MDYYESATLDGASAFEKFRHITLPLIVPSLTVVVTLSIAGGLKVFDIIYVITNGGRALIHRCCLRIHINRLVLGS